MNIDKYFSKRYDAQTYNCAHLVYDLWKDQFGEQRAQALKGFLFPPDERQVIVEDIRRFKLIKMPVDYCIVLMQSRRKAPHVGMWLQRKVVHIIEGKGVQYQPLEVVSIGFKKVRFVTCQD